MTNDDRNHSSLFPRPMFNIWLRTLQLSLKSLWMHPLRSSLTVLGIFIGVSSVIWLLALGQGIGRAAQEQIASLGAMNIIVRTVKPSSDEAEDAGYGLTCRRSTRRSRFAC
jgi:putative ABC transport system permease protein